MIEMRKRKRSETASFFLAKMFYFLLFVSRILYLNLYASRVSLYQHMPWWSSWCFLSHLPSHARYQLCSTGYVVHAWFISNTHGSNHFVIRIFGRRRALFTTPLIQHQGGDPDREPLRRVLQERPAREPRAAAEVQEEPRPRGRPADTWRRRSLVSISSQCFSNFCRA